ncbi:MAG: ABC transporter substrate-binding protein [Negativicutes bacterium]|nr:ABC transporter substrate-binding protein [Negativicutes bacterium]
MLISTIMAGCGGGKTETAQQIIIGENVDLGGYDPGTDMSPFIRTLIFNCLVELDADFKLTPGLAERWEMTPDGKMWTFYLRKGVSFHDGTPLTADIVKKNMDRLKNGAGKAWLTDVAEVQTINEVTVKFIMKSPSFTFASDLAVPFISIVSPGAVDASGKVVKAIGTGPFSLETWVKDQEFVLSRNTNYWGGAPKVEKLVFKVIRDPDARAMALEAGSVDIISLRQTLTAASRLATNNKIKIDKRLGQTSEIMFLNVDSPALQDLAVRKAVGHSLNIREMIPGLLGDNAEPGQTFFSPAYGKFVMPQNSVLPYDLAKAKGLLDDAGWREMGANAIRTKEGAALRLRLVYGAKNAEDSLLAGAIQNDLKAAGIAVSLVPLEDAALMDSLKNKNYDLIMVGQSFIPHDEPSSHYRRGYFHPQSTYNVFRTPELTKTIDQLFATADTNERFALHHRIQSVISEQVPVIVLFHRNNMVAMKKNIMGYKVSVGTWQLYRGLDKAYVQQ